MSEARPEDPRPEPGAHQHRTNGDLSSESPARGSLTRAQAAQSMDSVLDQREPRSKLLGKWHRNAH